MQVRIPPVALTKKARWCKGNTGDFDSLILGSNPGRATIYNMNLAELVQIVDNQIKELCEEGQYLTSTIPPLLKLRNEMIRKYISSEKEDELLIKDKKIIEVLETIGWVKAYE